MSDKRIAHKLALAQLRKSAITDEPRDMKDFWRHMPPAVRNSYPNVLDMYYIQDFGRLVRTSKGWYGSNDIRVEEIGVTPNNQLNLTVGPFRDKETARKTYEAAMYKMYK